MYLSLLAMVVDEVSGRVVLAGSRVSVGTRSLPELTACNVAQHHLGEGEVLELVCSAVWLTCDSQAIDRWHGRCRQAEDLSDQGNQKEVCWRLTSHARLKGLTPISLNEWFS